MFTALLKHFPISTVLLLLVIVILFLKTKHHPPFIAQRSARIAILIIAACLIISSVSLVAFVLLYEKDLFYLDIGFGAFLMGFFLTGLIAQTSQDPMDSTL